MKFNISIDVNIDDTLPSDCIAKIYYPNEGNKILIQKDLNAISFSEAIYHEIGHLFDWYLSNQSENTEVRELNAIKIGESLRFREYE